MRPLQLDSALEAYGPETQPARAAFARRSMRLTRRSGATRQAPPAAAVKSIFAGAKALDQYVLSLSPKTDGKGRRFDRELGRCDINGPGS